MVDLLQSSQLKMFHFLPNEMWICWVGSDNLGMRWRQTRSLRWEEWSSANHRLWENTDLRSADLQRSWQRFSFKVKSHQTLFDSKNSFYNQTTNITENLCNQKLLSPIRSTSLFARAWWHLLSLAKHTHCMRIHEIPDQSLDFMSKSKPFWYFEPWSLYRRQKTLVVWQVVKMSVFLFLCVCVNLKALSWLQQNYICPYFYKLVSK